MANPYPFSNPPTVNPFFGLVFLFWLTACVTWQIRNPIANSWTVITRIGHVVCFDKMAEYQVVETHKSIGK